MEDGSPHVAHVLKKKGGYSIRVLRTHATQRADVDRHVGGHFFVTDLIITPQSILHVTIKSESVGPGCCVEFYELKWLRCTS